MYGGVIGASKIGVIGNPHFEEHPARPVARLKAESTGRRRGV